MRASGGLEGKPSRQRIRSAIGRTPGIFDKLTVDLEAGIPGVSFKVGSEPGGLRCSGCRSGWSGIVILFCSPLTKLMRRIRWCSAGFSTAVQLAGQQCPTGAVLARTPRLANTLAASRVSFWSRGEKITVGLLPEGEARAVQARPLLDAGLEADADVVAA